jgi:hypothetical protein
MLMMLLINFLNLCFLYYKSIFKNNLKKIKNFFKKFRWDQIWGTHSQLIIPTSYTQTVNFVNSETEKLVKIKLQRKET